MVCLKHMALPLWTAMLIFCRRKLAALGSRIIIIMIIIIIIITIIVELLVKRLTQISHEALITKFK